MASIPYGPNNGMAELLQRLVNTAGFRGMGGGISGDGVRGIASAAGPIGRAFNNLGSTVRGASLNTSNGIGGNLGGGIGAIAGRLGSALGNGGQQPQQQDPLMDLYNQLINQLSSPVQMPTGVDTEDLMKQIQGAINPIYDQRASQAKSQDAYGRQEVEDMYRSLSNDYERLAPEQIAQAEAAKKEVEQMYGQLRSNVEGSYSRVSKEQGDLFKQLGIESALPSVLEDQAPAVTDALTAANQNQAQQEQRYTDIGQMDATYMREGSPIATMRGNEIQTDMLSQLDDYLKQIEAERSSGIQTAYMDQLGQANSLLGQQQQTAQGEAARRQEMLWNILQSQLQGNNQQLTPDSFMGSLPGAVQQSVASAFTQLQRSPEAVYGKTHDPRSADPGSFTETTPQWYMAQADEMLKAGQITPEVHQALLMYMQLRFKQ
jgi:hypothetical protein